MGLVIVALARTSQGSSQSEHNWRLQPFEAVHLFVPEVGASLGGVSSPIYCACFPCFSSDLQAFDRSVAAASETGTKQMWGGSSRVLALFPAKWDLAGVIAGVEEVNILLR